MPLSVTIDSWEVEFAQVAEARRVIRRTLRPGQSLEFSHEGDNVAFTFFIEEGFGNLPSVLRDNYQRYRAVEVDEDAEPERLTCSYTFQVFQPTAVCDALREWREFLQSRPPIDDDLDPPEAPPFSNSFDQLLLSDSVAVREISEAVHSIVQISKGEARVTSTESARQGVALKVALTGTNQLEARLVHDHLRTRLSSCDSTEAVFDEPESRLTFVVDLDVLSPEAVVSELGVRLSSAEDRYQVLLS